MNQATVKPTIIDALEHFTTQGYLSEAQREQLSISNEGNLRTLINNGFVPESAFAETLSAVYRFPVLGRDQFPRTAVNGTQQLANFLLEHETLPLSLEGGVLRLAMSDPSDEFSLKVLRSKLNCEIHTYVSLRSDLLEGLSAIYSSDINSSTGANKSNTVLAVDLPDDLGSDSALVRDLHRIIQRAVSINASDIHFEPIDSQLRVRFRVHGMLRDIHTFDAEHGDQIVARLKLMSKLDVTQRRHAQNGRFKFPADGRVIDLRVSTLPLHDGESIVLRLLEFELSRLSLQELGFTNSVADSLEQVINTQQGLVLITGPTGSGKSTTLYSLLNQLNKPEVKLISIEDPVELNIAGVNQIQVDDEHGLSFASALKTVLRQDPDVIMVGEIRDVETAQLAAQAALTGHLVLATLHTASAASAITRLQNLGLPEYLVFATVKAVLAQRLLRCICQECFGGTDCGRCLKCAGVGYFGRTTVAELLPISAFNSGTEISEDSLSTKLLDGINLGDDALRLLAAKLVDRTEIIRVLGIEA